MALPKKKNRYPGIRSFEAMDEILFYGRDREIDELYNLIKIKSLIVLFGKSGLGKTSLLKAGVGPLLIQENFYPIIIRLQDTSTSPTKAVLDALKPYVDNNILQKFGNKSRNEIWEHLNACIFKTPEGKKAKPILIFDQFEELFNHKQKVYEEWTAFIADIIDGRLPVDIENVLHEIPRSKRTPDLMDWFSPPEAKVIFAIRSDRMSELHQLRYEIPAILQNRYELKPLQASEARAAIVNPASLPDAGFSTQAFDYADETVQKIQKELSNEFGEIESFQLQIVCQHIEQKVIKAQSATNGKVIVGLNYLDEKGIQDILKNYYNTQVASLGMKKEQKKVRELLEEGLIMNGRRISVAEAVVTDSYNISEDLLDKLLASRLIRPEDTRLGRTYEISHDTLVKPITEAYERRSLREAETEKWDELKRKAKSLGVIVILLLGLSVFAFYQTYTAYQQKNQIERTSNRLKKQKEAFALERDSFAKEYDSLLALVAITEEDTSVGDVGGKPVSSNSSGQTETAREREQRLAKEAAAQEEAEKKRQAKARAEIQTRVDHKKDEDNQRLIYIEDLYHKDKRRQEVAIKMLIGKYADTPGFVKELTEFSLKGDKNNGVCNVILVLANLDARFFKGVSMQVYISKLKKKNPELKRCSGYSRNVRTILSKSRTKK